MKTSAKYFHLAIAVGPKVK